MMLEALLDLLVGMIALTAAALLIANRNTSASQIFAWYRRPEDGIGPAWARKIRMKPSMEQAHLINWCLILFALGVGTAGVLAGLRGIW